MLAPLVLAKDLIYAHKLSFSSQWRQPQVQNSRRLLLKVSAIFILLAGTMYARLWVMGFQGPSFQVPDNPAAFQTSLWLRIANRSYQYALHTWIMFAPDWLCFDWAMGCVPLIESWKDLR